MRLLIERGADIHTSRDDGTKALSLAAQTDSEMVLLLLEAGAEVNAGDWEGRTALMESARYGNEEVAALLLEHGADVNAKMLPPPDAESEGSRSVLMEAVKSQHIDVVRLLLEHGADVNAADEAGFTPLMWEPGACFGSEDSEVWKRCVARVRLLLEWDADLNRRNIQNETALDIAVCGLWSGGEGDEGEWSEIAHLLAAAGAVRGEPSPRFCYQTISDIRYLDPTEDDETAAGGSH